LAQAILAQAIWARAAQQAVPGSQRSFAMGCNGSTQRAAVDPAEVKVQQPEEVKTEPQPAAKPALKVGDKVRVSLEGGYEAEVLKYTTTDVLVKTHEGKEKWVDTEDVQLFASSPPLLTEVKVGTEVTTALGTSGAVVKRTTTEVCLRAPDGQESWVGIEDVTMLEVSILGAVGLHNKDWIGKSDPYCICQIEGKPCTKVQTETMTDRLDPVWGFEAGIVSYAKGDSLKFEVFDQDKFKKDDFLGQAVLRSEDFHSGGFYGDLQLLSQEGKPGMGTLLVKVVVKQAAADGPPAPARAPPRPAPGEEEVPVRTSEVTEEAVPRKSWCC